MSLSFWITTFGGVCVVATLLHAGSAPATGPAADRALLDSAAAAQEAGNFAEAEAALDKALATPDGAACAEYQVAREVLRRIRLDFSLTLDALLAKVRKDIPDVSAEDLERWRGQGVLQHRMIDGQVCYFNREPANLYRFCAEAKERRGRNRRRRPGNDGKSRFHPGRPSGQAGGDWRSVRRSCDLSRQAQRPLPLKVHDGHPP